MTSPEPRLHRWLLALHARLLDFFPGTFPAPWAGDAHQTARDAVGRARAMSGWTAGTFTALAECGDVVAQGLRGTLTRPTGSGVAADVRFALRRLRRRPVRTVAVVLTMAVGIGASTGVFGVVNNTLLRPMMLEDIHRLVRIDDVREDGTRVGNVSPLNAAAVAGSAESLSDVAIQDYRPFILSNTGEPERLRGAGVSAGWAHVLGVEPILGRTFTEEEHRLGEESEAVLVSHDLWQRHWGGEPTALGTTVLLNGEPRTIVGVMPPGFHFPYEANVWSPIGYDPTVGDAHYLLVFGRMAPGVALTAVQEDLDHLAQRMAERHPGTNRGIRMRAVALRDDLVRGYDRTALALFSVVGFLLLVGAVNTASLGLAEAAARRREMALRAALGAGRGRRLRQLLTESTILTLLGGGLGLLLAALLHPFLSLMVPPVMTVELAQDRTALDGTVLLFALGASGVVALVSGVLPALRASVADVGVVLRGGGRNRAGEGAGPGFLLVGLEIALATVLITGAAAVTAAFLDDQARPLGYEPEAVLTFRATLPPYRFPENEDRVRSVESLTAALRGVPGVEVAGASTANPALGGWVATVHGDLGEDGRDGVPAHLRLVTPGFVEALSIPILSGRELDARDRTGPPAALVSESLARRLWGSERAALGRALTAPTGVESRSTFTVVGVVGDLREATVATAAAVYLPYTRHAGRLPAQEPHFFVRARPGADPGSLATPVRIAVQAVDPDIPVFALGVQARVRSTAYVLERAGAALAAGLVGFGLLLAGLGVFGVVAHAVQRTRTVLGIRKALGADRRDIFLSALRPVVVAVGGGTAAGVAVAWLTNRLLRSVIPGIPRPDPGLYATVVGVLLVVALGAALQPAARAALVDPMRELSGD